jgi:hypothetical protein
MLDFSQPSFVFLRRKAHEQLAAPDVETFRRRYQSEMRRGHDDFVQSERADRINSRSCIDT